MPCFVPRSGERTPLVTLDDLNTRIAYELGLLKVELTAERKVERAADAELMQQQLQSKLESIKQPRVTGVTGRVSEGADTKLAVSGVNFAKGSWITVEGDAVDTPIKLETDFKSSSLVVARTKADQLTYAPQRAYSLRVTNPVGGFNDVLAGDKVDASVAWKTPAGSLGWFERVPAKYGEGARFFPAGSKTPSRSAPNVSATDADGEAVAYTIASGKLPGGITLVKGTGSFAGVPDPVSEVSVYLLVT